MGDTSLISGTVLDAAGKPLSFARVYFTGGPDSRPDIAALTDQNGRFTLTAPTPGEYEIECAADGYLPERQTIIAAAGKTYEVEFRLRPA